MNRQYVATTDPSFKEKYAFSPYNEKHTELLREFVALEITRAAEPAVAPVLDAVENDFYGENILIFSAHRVMIFDAVYDYLRANDLWQELFVLPEPVEMIPAEALPEAA
jgi:hypothetical protein